MIFGKLKHQGNPYSTFLAIHFEVGGYTENLEHQNKFWQTTLNLISSADSNEARLTLQFNPQWAEYILADKNKFITVKKWQTNGHEISLHHHGYDHGDWNGYSDRPGSEGKPGYRGNMKDLVLLMNKLAEPYDLLSGTVTDEMFDYPEGIKYETEGMDICHARTKPLKVTLNGMEVIQVGMAFLSHDGNIDRFKREYMRSKPDEIFGVVTHEIDFAEHPDIFEKWMKFINSKGGKILTVSEIIKEYKKIYPVKSGTDPLIFSKDVI